MKIKKDNEKFDAKFVWKDNNKLFISGYIDEYFNPAGVLDSAPNELSVDLSGIKRINSSGIREWVNFIRKYSNKKMNFERVPFSIVEQLSLVPEFLGYNNQVISFDVHFICEHCNNQEIFNFVVGVDIAAGLLDYSTTPNKKCAKCGQDMECDHNPQSYFHFLTRMKLS